MAVTFSNVVTGQLIEASHINELQGAMDGTAGQGKLIRHTNLDYDAGFAVIIRNQGDGGALDVQNAAGTSLFKVNDTGATFLATAGSARVIVGSGAFKAGIDSQITTPGLMKILDGSEASPSSVQGPAVSISKIAGARINDGVG